MTPKRKSKKVPVATCTKPDRDVPALQCGYPLPCPHHTVRVAVVVPPNFLEELKRIALGEYD